MTDYPVTVHGGPEDGETVTLGDPMPRYGTFWARVDGGELYPYQMRPGDDPPYEADWVDPDAPAPDDDEFATGAGPPGPTGPTGPTGEPGPTGPAGEDGRSVTYQGEWDTDTTYTAVDVVTHDDVAYLSLRDLNTGNQPDTHPADWAPLTGTPGEPKTIQDEGAALAQRDILNFVGAGVTATDDAANDRTLVTIAGGGGGGDGNVDGGHPDSTYGGTPLIDGDDP